MRKSVKRTELNSSHNSYWLLLLFALYGPSLSIFGEFRYVEIILLGMSVFYLNDIWLKSGLQERRVFWLFCLTASVYLVADKFNDADTIASLKRVGSYLMLAILVLTLNWLTQNSIRRIFYIIFGYCLSYVFMLIVGNTINPAYSEVPWRLGLGYAFTLAFCSFPLIWHGRLKLCSVLLLVLSAVHMALGARSLAIITVSVALLSFYSIFKARKYPSGFSIPLLAKFTFFSVLFLFSMYSLILVATANRLFSHDLQSKMEWQLNSSYNLIEMARPDTAAAVYAISQRPFLGYGTGNVDYEVAAYLVQLIVADADASAYFRLMKEDLGAGTPSHSHLFSAWADAGVVAALGWIYVFCLSLYCILRVFQWNIPFQPLVVFVCISNFWDILFSPGPHRMDMAVRMIVLFFFLRVLKHYGSRMKSKPALRVPR